MKPEITLMLIIFLSINNFILAQIAPDTLWTKTFGGAADDQAVAIQQTSDGGYIVLGSTQSYGSGQLDTWLVKIDENGDEIWNKTFGGPANDGAVSIQQTNDRGYIFAGLTKSFGAGGEDFWLVKTDSIGNEIWSKTFGGTADDRAQYVEQLSDGGYIVTGGTYSFNNGNGDVWLIKTDENGNEIWNRTHGGSGDEKAYSVHQTSDGGYVLAGYTDPFRNLKFDILLFRTDGNGNEIWSRTFGGTNIENAYSCELTNDGGYLLAGYTKSFGNGQDDIWLIKTDDDGNEEWNKTFGGTGVDYNYSVQQTKDGGYIISGFTNSKGNGGFDIWFIKTAENGEEVWNQTIGGTSDEFSFSVQQTSDGGYIVAGSTFSFGSGGQDFYIIKLDSDESTSVPHNQVVPKETYLLSNYPNPFNPSTTMTYHLFNRSIVTLQIYNSLGEQVKLMQLGYQNSGKHIATWDGTNDYGQPVGSGIYVYKLEVDGKSEVKKMMLIR